MRDEASTRPHDQVADGVVDQVVQACPTGYLWYSCATNNFIGCCSINPCGLGASCPADSQLPMSSTLSTPNSTETTLSAVISPVVVSSTAITSSAVTPTSKAESTPSQIILSATTFPLIKSSGVASLGMTFVTSASTTSTTTTSAITSALESISTQSPFLTTLSASETITVFVPLSSDGSPTGSIRTVVSTTVPSPPPAQSTSPTSAAIVNIGTNDGQTFPISMVVGVVTGFSILILVMGVMFCLLWRNRRIRVVDDDEAMELQQRRLALRPWYLPPQQVPNKPEEEPSVVGTPVGAGGFPELDVPFRDRYPEMPRRSTFPDINKPCPPVPLSSSRPSSSGPTPGALGRTRGIFMMGGESRSRITQPPLSLSLSPTSTSSTHGKNYLLTPPPGRIDDYSDPFRNSVANTSTPHRQSLRAVPYSPSKAALSSSPRAAAGAALSPPLQGDCSFRSSASGGAMLRHSPSGSVSALESIGGGYGYGGGGGGSNHSHDRDSELTSELTSMAPPRAGYAELDCSQSHYYELTPPPRRRPRSEGSEAKSAGEGRIISRHSGLRLSGVSQGLVEERSDGKDADTTPPTEGPSSYRQGGVGEQGEAGAVPSSSGQRRLTR